MNDQTILWASPLSLDLVDQTARLDGRPIELGPKLFALLRTLMEAHARVVTKEELFDSVWAGKFVSEAVLTTAIRDLRIALGDNAKQPLFLGTAHGRGYRFLKPVERRAPGDPPVTAPEPLKSEQVVIQQAPASKPASIWSLAGILAVLVIALVAIGAPVILSRTGNAASAPTGGAASIAVLPFEDLSPSGENGYFAKGLSEEILNVLMGVDGLTTASRTSSFAFAGRSDLTTPAIGSELGVGHVLEGSTRLDGKRVRVHVRLVDVKTDRAVWSRKYERELSVDNLLRIQDEVAERVVAELGRSVGADLGAHDARARSAAAGTSSLPAYESFLRARELFMARSDIDRSIAFATEATTADPSFARAWELRAAALYIAGKADTAVPAIESVNRALKLDPNLSLAHALKGMMIVNTLPGDWSGGIASMERALEIEPDNTTALLWLGNQMHKLGYLAPAQELLERCLRLDPAYDRCRLHLAWTLHMRGDTLHAMDEYRRLVRDGAHPRDTMLLQAFIAHGAESEVRDVIKSIRADTPVPEVILAALQDPARDPRPAVAALRTWIYDVVFPSDLYPVIIELKAYDLIPDYLGSNFALWLPETPEYRSSPRFKQFVRTMKIEAYWRTHGFPPQCHPIGADDFECT